MPLIPEGALAKQVEGGQAPERPSPEPLVPAHGFGARRPGRRRSIAVKEPQADLGRGTRGAGQKWDARSVGMECETSNGVESCDGRGGSSRMKSRGLTEVIPTMRPKALGPQM